MLCCAIEATLAGSAMRPRDTLHVFSGIVSQPSSRCAPSRDKVFQINDCRRAKELPIFLIVILGIEFLAGACGKQCFFPSL